MNSAAEDIREDIKNYISVLKAKHGISVTLHPKEYEEFISLSDLMQFNIHLSPYCCYLKQHPDAGNTCVEKQNRVFEKCKNGEFCGTCHAGVVEYIYPIKAKGHTVGFISAGGFQADAQTMEHCLEKVSRLYSFQLNELRLIYSASFSPEKPAKTEMDALLRPLCRMLELAYEKLPDTAAGKTDNLYLQILYYLNLNHSFPITLDTLCEQFYCSKSHISHTFKKHNGDSISNYLNRMRISDAKLLLANSALSMTAIAAAVGFSDSNYFAVVFKKHEGITPTQYRTKKYISSAEAMRKDTSP